MMGVYRSLAGSVQVSLMSADIPECLSALEQARISAFDIQTIDAVTLKLTVSRKHIRKLQQLCERKGYTLGITHRQGLFWMLSGMLKRPVFLLGIMMLFLLAVCLPARILFVDTEGNEAVPSRYILEKAADCGLQFWSRRREVRSEQIKNGLLETIPQLQWVGVNTYGCRAVITVRERAEPPENHLGAPISHVAAARDGIVRSCTVTRGSGNCAVRQAVKKGDILISGYTDCGLTYTAERAEGEILAQTKRQLRITTPKTCYIQTQTDRSDIKVSLLVGKKRINFYKGSGISGGSCDKMYSKYVLTLPGGFSLPVALLTETTVTCRITDSEQEQAELLLRELASEYLMGQMTDGSVLAKSEATAESNGTVQLLGTYDCLENIGIIQEEKIGEFDG